MRGSVALDTEISLRQRAGGNADGYGAGRDIARDHGVGAYDRAIADTDAGQDSDATANPYLVTDTYGCRTVSGLAQGLVCTKDMIGVADTAVLANHGAVTDGYSMARHQMDAARQYDPIAQSDAAISLCFPVKIAVEIVVPPQSDIATTVYFWETKDNIGRVRGIV
jgi:hypothetical protein